VKSEDMKMDALSRWEDKDDWRVADWVFQLAEERWGPHNIADLQTRGTANAKGGTAGTGQ
jgi:hypothetical protein